VIEWPAELPTDLLIGHSETALANLAAFQPLVGAPALYQVGDSQVRTVPGRLRISDAQRLVWLDFYSDTLAMGTRRFSLQSSGFDGETWQCQLADQQPYQLEGAAAGWWLTLSLVLVRRLA
jgi:hypothetical protein